MVCQKTIALYSVIRFTYLLDPSHLFCLAEENVKTIIKISDTVLIYICLIVPFGKRKYFYCVSSVVSLYSLKLYFMIYFYSKLIL